MKARRVEPYFADLVQCCGLRFVDMRAVAEWEILRAAMYQYGGNISEAARELSLSRSWLHELMRRHKIRRQDYELGCQGTEVDAISKETDEFVDLIMKM